MASDPKDLIAEYATRHEGRLAVVSSFGTESAVLLHHVAQVDRTLPIISLDTGKLFGVTHSYREELTDLLGLTDVRVIKPHAIDVTREDPKGHLWSDNPDRCCAIRKVWPLVRALNGFDAWVSGRKSHQTAHRENSAEISEQDGRTVVNPLHHWSEDQIQAYFEDHNLPRHPLEKDGYTSVGCFTCTSRVAEGEDRRAGRWRGSDKTECGIHLGAVSRPAA